jgi:single-strand DNA-binding protein
MNKVILIGNLTKDPEIKVAPSGSKIARFSIAVNEGKNKEGQELVQYFNLTAWERLAEIVEMYVKKGYKVAVTGKIQNRSWDKPDGTKGYATDIRVSELEILTSKNEAQRINPETSQPTNNNQSNSQNNHKNEEMEDEKLPEIDVDEINVSMPF